MLANLINRISGNKEKASSNYLPFRVMFRSPFFELEIDSGNGWQTAHSQDAEKLEDGTLVYQVLRFRSFSEAETYAKDTLGLSVLKPKSLFGFYIAPTASYEKDTTMIAQPEHGVVEGGKVVRADQQEDMKRAQKVSPIKVFTQNTVAA